MKKAILLFTILFLSQNWGQQYSIKIRVGKILYTNEGWEINYPYGNLADVFDSNNNLIPCANLPSNTNYRWYRKECQMGPNFILQHSGRYDSAYYCDGQISLEGEPNPTQTCDNNLNFSNYYVKVVVTISGLDYPSQEIRLPDNETGIVEQKLVTVNQKKSNQSQIGRIGKTYINNFYNYIPPVTFTYPARSNHDISDIFQASQSIISNEKYLHWSGFSNVVNHKDFTFNIYSTNITSQFNTVVNATVKANMAEYPDFKLDFIDPWLIDDFSDPLGPRNRGMENAIPYSLNNIQNNLDLNSSHQGVLLGQDPSQTVTYYKISIPSSMTTPQNNDEHNVYIQDWDIAGAWLQDPNSLTTGIVFTSANGVTITANLKAQGLSDDQFAYSSSSQRKFVRSLDGTLLNTYRSMDNLWLEVKSEIGWIINNSEPLNTEPAKGPAMDYASYSSHGSNPVYQLIVVFQEKSGTNSNIVIKYFEKNNIVENPLSWDLLDTKSFQAASNQYDDINCTPVVAFNPVNQAFKVVFKGTDGLYYKTGSVLASNLPPPGGPVGIVIDNDPPVKIIGTTSSAINPTIYTTKDDIYTQLAWEENNSIKYINAISANPTIRTISGNVAFTYNHNPSIIVLDDHSARVVWRGSRSIYPDKIGGETYKQNTVIYKDPDVQGFIQFGSDAGNPTINKAAEGDYFAFAWSENDGDDIKFADNTLNGMWTMPNNTGTDVQLSNGQNKFSMFAESFDYGTVPYYFKTSGNLASMQNSPPPPPGTEGPMEGREGTIASEGAEFFFNFGDITIDGRGVDFVALPERPEYDSYETLNEYSLTEPFDISDGVEFLYTVLYGIKDSAKAASVLTDGKYVSYSLYLVDDITGETLAPLDNVVYEEGNIFQYANIRYQLDIEGMGNRTVRMKLVTINNFDATYSLNESHTDDTGSLGKVTIKHKKIAAACNKI